MVNPISESTSSALEAAAMDIESTKRTISEPEAPNAHNGSNGHNSSYTDPSVSTHSDNISAEVEQPMEENPTNSTESDTKRTNVSAVYGDYDDYQLLPDAPWPPPVFVRQAITPQERYYIEHRWYSQWSFFDNKASQNKNRYYRTQLIVGIGSVTVPVLVGINATEPISSTVLYFTTVIISLAVAMATAVESLYTFGDNWRSYRSAAEEMRQEKSLYDVKAGRYANNQQSFIRFVERCEEIIAQQNGRWVQSQEKASEQIAQDAEEFAEIYGTQNAKTDEFGNPIAKTTATSITSVTQSTPDGISTTQTESTYSEVAPTAEAYIADTVTETYTDPSIDYIDPNTADPSTPTSFG